MNIDRMDIDNPGFAAHVDCIEIGSSTVMLHPDGFRFRVRWHRIPDREFCPLDVLCQVYSGIVLDIDEPGWADEVVREGLDLHDSHDFLDAFDAAVAAVED